MSLCLQKQAAERGGRDQPPAQALLPPGADLALGEETRSALGGDSINPLVAFRVGVLQKLSRKKYGPKILDVGAATDGPKPASFSEGKVSPAKGSWMNRGQQCCLGEGVRPDGKRKGPEAEKAF